MGLIELIVGLLVFLLIANIFLSLIPIPNNIAGTLITILILLVIWRMVF
jgi:hypothetical protein